MRVVEVNSIDGLPGLRLAWRSLLSETPGANFNQSCEWLEAAHRHQPPTSRLRVLLVTGGGETVGILPLVQSTRATRFGTLRVLGYPGDPWSPCQGPLGPHPTATLMAALRYLANSARGWDVLEFRDVNRATADYQRTRTALQVAEMHFQETDEAPCHVIDLPIPSSDRGARPALADRHLIASGQQSFERHRPRGSMYDDANPRWDLFDRCLELPHWQQPGNAAKEFLRDVHAAACRWGAADMNVLRRGNQMVACCYNVHLGGVLLTVFGDSLVENHRPHREDRAAMQTLVAAMLQDSVAKHDLRWFPGGKLSCLPWPSTPLRRSRFVHHRGNRAVRLMQRVADWLPLPT